MRFQQIIGFLPAFNRLPGIFALLQDPPDSVVGTCDNVASRFSGIGFGNWVGGWLGSAWVSRRQIIQRRGLDVRYRLRSFVDGMRHGLIKHHWSLRANYSLNRLDCVTREGLNETPCIYRMVVSFYFRIERSQRDMVFQKDRELARKNSRENALFCRCELIQHSGLTIGQEHVSRPSFRW